jgi:hypothetical protein
MIVILLISPIYKEIIFALFFDYLITRMSFGQKIKLLNTCFVYDILYILILQPITHVLTQVFIRILNVCSFTG